MVYAFTFVLYHSFSTRRSERSFRKENLMMSYLPPSNLYSKSNRKPLKVHKHGLWEPTWSSLHLLLNPHTWYHVPPFFFDSRHTFFNSRHIIVLPARNTMLQFFHMEVFLSGSQSSPPSSLLLGLGNFYSLFTAQFNGHFLREVFSHFSDLIKLPYKEFL